MRGFDTTTLDDIALHMGIGRRTVYRYFPSKFDIPWGQFDQNLETFRGRLNLSPVTVPLWKGIQEAVIDFNSFDENVLDQHRQRMRLIFETPSLQAHSFLMYQRWRGVIAEFVAQRTGESCDAAMPVTVGHASLGLAWPTVTGMAASHDSPVRFATNSAITPRHRWYIRNECA